MICSANQLTGFYMMATLAFNDLIEFVKLVYLIKIRVYIVYLVDDYLRGSHSLFWYLLQVCCYKQSANKSVVLRNQLKLME